MARLASPRHALHRGLWVANLRAGDDSPLSSSCHCAVPSACRSRRLQTQGFRRCGPNATFQTRLRPCDDGSSSPSSEACRDVHVAPLQSHHQHTAEFCDAVRLGSRGCNHFSSLASKLDQIVLFWINSLQYERKTFAWSHGTQSSSENEALLRHNQRVPQFVFHRNW